MKYRIIIGFIILNMACNIQAELVDRILAVVNNDIVTLSEFNKTYARLAMQIRASDYSQAQQRDLLSDLNAKVLDTLIEEMLTAQQASTFEIEVNEKEIDSAINEIKSRHHYTDDEFENVLLMQGSNIKEYREHIRKQKIQSRLVGIMVQSKVVITDDDVKAYYDSHPEQFQSKTTYHLRTIIKRSTSDNAYTEMEQALTAFSAGTPFTELARQYADPPFNETGGLLGSYSLDQLSMQIQDAIKDLQTDSCSKVLKSDQGLQILYVENITQEGGQTLDEATINIRNLLYQTKMEQRYHAWIDDLKEKSHIKILD
ncbi:MAG: peptidyl-prolyl cis-trans isomerase SurA [Candidatus Magnetoglobus multicellularis str. Araruama]|uniref:Peptidyl-prolyl cis-trans isomerase SurA n=1 Tax=Candidatus Magnetoglobus multicellularis str. Araruama TaxID=890399 RepID=A0A1V1P3C0_9BACT|nr:MAG: peptidyl-prolyl cis-trans isomerase SurA [Candidatus Magnetoglobus multicellularis str. Araruama]